MGLKVYFGSHTEKLGEQLARDLAGNAYAQGPFGAPLVIVPNPNLKLWLQLKIAARNSVAANIRFTYLEKGLWDLIAELDPALEGKPSILTGETYIPLILGELFRMKAGDKELAPLWKYLHDEKDKPVIDYYRKAWQLSEKLEKCFREYEYNRGEMIAAWLRGETYYKEGSPNQKKMEACQRVLYTRIFGPGGTRDSLGESQGELFLTLPQYMKRIFRSGDKKLSAKRSGVPIYIFGLSQISAFHTELLFEVGKYFDIRLYQINVCREFWEDVETPQEERFRKFKKIDIKHDDEGEYLEEDKTDNRLLRLWGKPGRENVKLLSELEERCSGKVEFDADWAVSSKEPVPDTKLSMLGAVQAHILDRIDGSEKLDQDTSIQIAGCPGVYREVETVHNSIISNMKSDPALKLTDIAVLVTSMADYKPAIKTVFSREPQLVPYNMTDSVASEDSIFAQGFLALLELVESPFSRHKVFSLILNDCFLAAMRISREAAITWLEWADKLDIFHSFDKEDKKTRGYAENDRYTWRQGLERLRFGRIMEKDDDADDAKMLRDYKGVIPFSDMDSENTQLVSDFSIIVEMLIARIPELAHGKRTCAEWARDIGIVVDELLRVPYDRPKEERIRGSVKRSLEALAGCDDVFGAMSSKKVEFGLAREFLTASLARVTAGHGKYLAGGVTISALLPMRPIPFRIVYVMGLGEGDFPGNPDRSTLDIRNYMRKLGDVSLPEANRYLFLETLMSVREKLYLTYVSQDTETDKPFHPCSVINELRGYLKENILKADFKTLKDEFKDWQDDIPLKGNSAKYLVDLDSVKGWSDILANYSVADRVSCLADFVEGDKPKLKLAAGDVAKFKKKREELVRWDAIGAPKKAEAAAVSETEHVSLRELEKFLLNPVEAALERHLGIYDREEEDRLEVEDEPFVSEFFVKHDLVTGLVKWFIPAWYDDAKVKEAPRERAKARLDEYYAYKQKQGKMPDGAFGDVDHEDSSETALEMIAGGNGIVAFLEGRGTKELHRNVAIGKTVSSVKASLQFEPLKLKLPAAGSRPAQVVELRGDLPFLWEDATSGGYETVVVTYQKDRSKEKLSKAVLKPILFYLMFRASGQGDKKSAPISIYVAGQDGVNKYWQGDVTQDEAKDYLLKLVTDYMDSGSFDYLPFELVKIKVNKSELVDNPTKEEQEEYRDNLVEELEECRANKAFAKYTPTDIVLAIEPKVPDDAYLKVVRRLKWLVDKIAQDPE